jgi:exonuclease SbcC
VRIESLSLKGILRFTDALTLDFRELPPGLIAMVGPNGAGKTTLMESPLAALYRQFPSRHREAFDYATGTDSFIETTFELEGRGLYRARLALDGPHRKAEATLAKVEADGRTVLLNDGKVSTYDAEVGKLLPPLRDLLASVFAAQNKVGAFSALDKKGKRELFASLLGLDHYEAMADRARQAVTRVTQAIERTSAIRDALARDAGPDVDDAIHRDAQRLQITLNTVELRRRELAGLIAQAEQALAAVQEDVSAHAAAAGRLDRLEAELLSKKVALQTVRDNLTRAEQGAAAERQRLIDALRRTLDRLDDEAADTRIITNERTQIALTRDAALAEARRRIEANEGLRQEADAIRNAVDAVASIEATLARNRERQDALQGEIDAVIVEHGRLQRARQAVEQRQLELARAQQDADLLQTVPCHGEGAFAACAFLTNARTAQAKIPALADVHAQAADLDATIAAAERQHGSLKAELSNRVSAFRQLSDAKAAEKVLADKLPHLAHAEARIEELKRAIADAEQRALADLAAADERERARQERLTRAVADRQEEHAGALTVLDVRVAEQRERDVAQAGRLEAELATLIAERALAQRDVDRTTRAAEQARLAETTLGLHRTEWDQTTARLASVETQMEELDRRRAVLQTRRVELDRTEAQIEALRSDLIEWSALGKAMSREGLPTIEIDQAGPTVSAYANDLLQACFGGRFSLELVTQAPKTTKGKDGSTHKDVFDANIYDQQRAGEERSLEDLSGGERVIVEEVLRSAIALLVNQKNAFPLRTLWRDETTGALDPENAEHYLAMLRRLQTIGGFDKVLFVTHNEDCARLADAQIRVDAGDYTIALPPFAGELVGA